MAQLQVLQRRFVELEAQMAAIEATRRYESGEFLSGDRIDTDILLAWGVKARHLISTACRLESEHYKSFIIAERGGSYLTSYDIYKSMRAVFLAAKEDFEGGYITSVQALVQAELFSSELEQAQELLRSGYRTAAAVIAGVVLETAMRELCQANSIAPASLNRMNTDLRKANVYNLLVEKRITALADIRNNAAHGHPDQFTDADVADMIRQVEGFLADHL